MECDLTAEKLRDNCPCAGCSGEGFMFRQYIPEKKQLPAEAYMLEKAEPVGHYSLRLFWKDGHDTGIYTFSYLKELSTK
jgi:DUF971 family protein